VASFVSNVRRGAEGLFLRVFDTYGNKVMRGAGQQVGQLAVQVTIGLQEAGGRAAEAAYSAQYRPSASLNAERGS